MSLKYKNNNCLGYTQDSSKSQAVFDSTATAYQFFHDYDSIIVSELMMKPIVQHLRIFAN